MFLPSMLADKAARHPRKLAVACEDRSLTFAELHRQARNLAGALGALGAGPGQAVGLVMPPCLAYAPCLAAPLLAGAVSVPLDHELEAEELALLARACGLTFLLASPDAPPIAGLTTLSGAALEALLDRDRPLEAPPAPAPDDHAIYVHTSGTTRRPRAVVMTHEIIARRAQNRRNLEVTGEDRCYTIGGLHHNGKLFIGLIWSLYLGMTFHAAPAFEPARVLEELAEHHVTLLHASPMHFAALARWDGAAPPLPELRLCISSGNHLRPAVARDFTHRFGAPVHENYGITEAGGLCTDGVPLDGVQIRILDRRGGRVKPGEVGEIVVTGPGCAHGYLRDAPSGRRGFRGRWFHTGDLGSLDSDGMLHVHRRVKAARGAVA